MSINRITFLHDIFPDFNGIHVFTNTINKIFYFFDKLEVSDLLETLEDNKIYVVSIELVKIGNLNIIQDPVITLSLPFIITKNSNPKLISDYIYNQANKACLIYLLEVEIGETTNVLVKYREINLL